MRNLDDTTITQAVLAMHRDAADARLSEVMTSLVQHLHAFARDIRLSEAEWRSAIDFLQRSGSAGAPGHSEFAQLSHALGLSTLVLAQARKAPAGSTEAAAFEGPQESAAQVLDLGADITATRPGPKRWVQGSVRDGKGRALPYAAILVSPSGLSGVPPSLLQADAQGRFHFCTTAPQSYQVLADGPLNTLLKALERPDWRPAHLEFVIKASGYRPLTTLVFTDGDEHLASDAFFGVRASLIAAWQEHPPGITPGGELSPEPFHSLSFDFVLAPA